MHEDIFEMAAAYLFHIVQNHPFVDGNKRTGAASAYIFLAMNNILFDADEDEFAFMVLDVADGRIGKSGIAQYLRENSSGTY
jgi:death-on-curing protein